MREEITLNVKPAVEITIGAETKRASLDLGQNGGMPVLLEQVQADWNEDDETSKAFIKNKPVVEDPIRVMILGESKV